MDGIARINGRILAIEQRFQRMPQFGATRFADALAQAEDRKKEPKSLSDDADGLVDMIKHSAERYGVDSKLALAVAKAESNLIPGAVSDAGAVGVMQLMPETAKELGVRNIYDINENIDGGVQYLKQMLTTFNGDVVRAVAAYNAGPQAVKQHGGVPPYPETKRYVSRVLDLYHG